LSLVKLMNLKRANSRLGTVTALLIKRLLLRKVLFQKLMSVI